MAHKNRVVVGESLDMRAISVDGLNHGLNEDRDRTKCGPVRDQSRTKPGLTKDMQNLPEAGAGSPDSAYKTCLLEGLR